MKGVLATVALVAMVARAQPHGCPRELSTTLLADFRDCAGFWRCADNAWQRQSCAAGQHFSSRLQRCTLPVFARCQAVAGDVPKHTDFLSGFLDKIRNVISRKAQPVPLANDELSAPPEVPSGELPAEKDTLRRFPDTVAEVPEVQGEAEEADVDIKQAEKSKVADSENEEEKSALVEAESELDTEEEVEQEEKVEDGKQEEQDESEQSVEKLEEEEDEVANEKEESEASDIEKVVAEKESENKQDLKKDTAVLKKNDEEEEDENEDKSNEVESIKNENRKNKSDEKEKESGSESESDDEE